MESSNTEFSFGDYVSNTEFLFVLFVVQPASDIHEKEIRMSRVEYQVYERDSGMTVAWADNLEDALHYLEVYTQAFPYGLHEVIIKKQTNLGPEP